MFCNINIREIKIDIAEEKIGNNGMPLNFSHHVFLL